MQASPPFAPPVTKTRRLYLQARRRAGPRRSSRAASPGAAAPYHRPRHRVAPAQWLQRSDRVPSALVSESPSRVAHATGAVYAVFILAGVVFASWASRIPQVRDALGLTPQALGLVLLAIALGSVTALPLSGVIVARLGTARTVRAMALLAALGLATAGLGSRVGVLPVV